MVPNSLLDMHLREHKVVRQKHFAVAALAVHSLHTYRRTRSEDLVDDPPLAAPSVEYCRESKMEDLDVTG